MNINIEKEFNKHYNDFVGLIRSKEVLNYYSYQKDNDLFRIRLLKGKGIFNTEVYMIQVLKEKDGSFTIRERLNKQFHFECKAVDYVSELMTGGLEHAKQGQF